MSSKSFLVACVLVTCGLLVGAVALEGCGGSPRSQLQFWHIQNYSPTQEVVNGAFARFQASHPEVTVDAVAVANDPFKTKLQVAVSSGDVPDVFHTWGGGMFRTYVKAGVVADLTDDLAAHGWSDRFNPAAAKCLTFDGRLYALPADVAPVVMWYNKKLFAEHGIAVPKTFDELKSVCRTLKEKSVTPIALGNIDRWPGCFYFDYLATRIGGTAPVRAAAERAPGGTFEHPSFIEAGRKLRELVDLGAFPDGASGLKDGEARNLFFTGRAAMMLMGTWTLAQVSTEAPSFAPDMECFAFPAVTGGQGSPTTVVGGVNAAYAVSARSAQPQAARDLAFELVSDQTCRAWATTGRIPALSRETVEPMLAPQSKPAAEILFAADEIQLYYDQYLPPALAEKHKATTTDLFLGKLTPERAAAEMEAAARDLTR